MTIDLKNWRRNWTLMSVFFKGDEIARITGKLKDLKIEHVVFCSFENRFAKSGGLASVVTNILPYLKEVNRIPDVLLFTPFYPCIVTGSRLKSTGIKFNVSYSNRRVPVELYKYTLRYNHPVKGTLHEYYLKAEGFFGSSNSLKDPYLYDEKNPERNNTLLSENALFFCKAVPQALKALNIRENIILHLNEWQTSLVSLTAKEAMINNTLHSCGTVQTMHNSFDSAVSWDLMTKLLSRKRRPKVAEFPGKGLTAYQIGLQLTDAPVTTVSKSFSEEFTSDTLQIRHFCPHLQNIFRLSGVFGINNGLFVEFSEKFPKKENHTLEEIRDIKLKNRKVLLRTLSRYNPPESFGELTYRRKTITRLPDNIPIFVMSGRLDTIQKGYDVLLRVVERFAEDEIKVILTPMPVYRDDLDYFYEVACKCKGNLKVFPIKVEKIYSEIQTGATYGIMPSLYEPFGAAVEYMAGGTVNIGRATGGLIDQIDSGCGFLYREDSGFYTLSNILDYISSCRTVQMRKTNPFVQSMVDNLYSVMRKAVNVYQTNTDRYYRMVLNGFKKAGQFNWEKTAADYYMVYEMVTKA